MSYTLPSLPYGYDALEPFFDTKTMEIHHTKHHQTYVNTLNTALEKHADLFDTPLDTLLTDLSAVPEDIRIAVRNHGGGHYNHSMFWQLLKKNDGQLPKELVAEQITKTFGSFKAFQELFNNTAKTVFGSGWAWLAVDAEGHLVVMATINQDTPISSGLRPVLGLDVWEHAYYLQYQNRRPDYINAWWHVIDWDRVEEYYRAIIGK